MKCRRGSSVCRSVSRLLLQGFDGYEHQADEYERPQAHPVACLAAIPRPPAAIVAAEELGVCA